METQTKENRVNSRRNYAKRGSVIPFLEGLVDTVECIVWPFAMQSTGYGQVRFRGTSMNAHRASLIIHKGEPPTGKHYACHDPLRCLRRDCVNPRHLYWATQSENEKDKVIEGVSNRGERCGNSVLTEADVISIRKMKRPGVGVAKISKALGLPRGAVHGVVYDGSWSWLK